MNPPFKSRRLPIIVASMVALAGNIALAAPEIRVDRTTAHLGKIYVSPDSSRYPGPYETLVITNAGDEVLQTTYTGPSLFPELLTIPPGDSRTLYLTPGRPLLGGEQWMIRLESNDPETPLLEIPASYEGIVQPPLVVEDLNGDPVVSGETVFQLDPALWDPNRNSPTAVPRVVTRTVRLRNTGEAFLPVRMKLWNGWSANNIVGSSIAGSTVPDLANTPVMVPPLGTTDLTLTLAPTSIGPIKTKVELSSYWKTHPMTRKTSVEFFLETVATGLARLDLEHSGSGIGPDGGMAPLVFPTRHLGEAANDLIVVRNAGKAPMTVDASILGGNHGDFIILSEFPVTVPPNQIFITRVSFSPTDGGSRSSTIRFTSDDPDRPQFDVALKGDGFRLVLGDPQGGDFGRTPVGTLETRTFTLENKGDKRITGISADLTSRAGGQLTLVGDIPWALDPGESCEFAVEFAPTQVGIKRSYLKVTTLENLTKPLLVAISATGIAAPSLVLSSERGYASSPGVTTMEAPYDSVDIGDYKRFAFDLRNTGTLPLTLASEFSAGSSIAFSLLAPLPASVAPGARVRFEITFRPKVAGDVGALFRLLTNDPDQAEFSIRLNGSGFPFSVETPEGTEFDVTEIGESEELTFVIVNNGAQALQGISASLTTDSTAKKSPVRREFTLASRIPRTLAPKQRVSFKVKFNPLSAGAKTLRLRLVSSKNRNRPLELRLKARAVRAPEIVVRNSAGKKLRSGSSFQAFGSVPLGLSVSRGFRISNTGTAPLVISGISVSGPSAAEFRIVGPSRFPVAPGKFVSFRALCKPAKEGRIVASIRIVTNDRGERVFVIPVRGLAARASTPAAKGALVSSSSVGASNLAPLSGMIGIEAPRPRVLSSITREEDGKKYRSVTVIHPPAGGRQPLVEVSSDLVNWYSGPRHTVVMHSDPWLLRVRDATAIDDGVKRFIRVRHVVAD